MPCRRAWGALLAFSLLAAGPAPAESPTLAQGQTLEEGPAREVQGFYGSESDGTRKPVDTVAVGSDVLSAADPRAAEAGRRMFAAGGTALDAALATMLALNVAEPQSSGIGGGAFLVFYDAKSGKTFTIDGREKAPAAARPGRFLANGRPMPFLDAVPGGLSVGVPGTLALIAEASARWGTLPWATLFAPAIELARKGVPVTARMHAFIGSRREMLAADREARALFLDRGGAPLPVGSLLKQPRLAKTLQRIAKEGPEAFYEGPIGKDISAAVAGARHNPAILTAADLAAYRAVERPPLCRPYRVWTICTMGPPSAGGIAILQILGELERFDLQALGPRNLLSWHLLAEAMRLSYADREAYGADADFYPVPIDGLLDKGYVQARSHLIHPERAMQEVTAGHPPGLPAPDGQQRLVDIPSTTHLAAADHQGNMVSVTSTIEGPFGSGLMADGFMLNNELTDFDFLPVRDGLPAPNRVEPGKRPRSSMAPTIIYRDGKPLATFGAAGGATIIAQIAKTVVAYLDWGLPPESAIATPQIYANGRGVFYEKGSYLEGMAAGLRAMGHRNVEAAALPLKGNGIAVQGDGLWRGAADVRSEGQAVACGGLNETG